jgi:TetR/AcrR family transcriptional regulator, fatty acid metabolism regulator protein
MSTSRPRRPLKEQMREVRAKHILEVVQEILIEKGSQDVSMDEIALRVGIAKGTLYLHFPHKEDLILALFEHYVTLFEQTVEEAVHAALPARAKLEKILKHVYLDPHGAYGMLQLLTHSAEMRKSLAERKEQAFQRVEYATLQIRSILAEGKANGSFDPAVSTGLMLSAFLSALTLGRPEQRFALEELSREDLVAQVGHLLFEGFRG